MHESQDLKPHNCNHWAFRDGPATETGTRPSRNRPSRPHSFMGIVTHYLTTCGDLIFCICKSKTCKWLFKFPSTFRWLFKTIFFRHEHLLSSSVLLHYSKPCLVQEISHYAQAVRNIQKHLGKPPAGECISCWLAYCCRVAGGRTPSAENQPVPAARVLGVLLVETEAETAAQSASPSHADSHRSQYSSLFFFF